MKRAIARRSVSQLARESAFALSQHIAVVCCGVAVVEMGRSTRWLADQAGITKGYLANVRNGRKVLGLDKTIALCMAVGLSLAEMLEAYEEEQS